MEGRVDRDVGRALAAPGADALRPYRRWCPGARSLPERLVDGFAKLSVRLREHPR